MLTRERRHEKRENDSSLFLLFLPPLNGWSGSVRMRKMSAVMKIGKRTEGTRDKTASLGNVSTVCLLRASDRAPLAPSNARTRSVLKREFGLESRPAAPRQESPLYAQGETRSSTRESTRPNREPRVYSTTKLALRLHATILAARAVRASLLATGSGVSSLCAGRHWLLVPRLYSTAGAVMRRPFARSASSRSTPWNAEHASFSEYLPGRSRARAANAASPHTDAFRGAQSRIHRWPICSDQIQ